MRLAARRYGVELRPISPVVKGGETGFEGDVYSLVSAYGLSDFDRVLSIETPGLLLDASPLDAVLAFTERAPFAMLHDTVADDGVHSEDLFLLQPSSDMYATLSATVSTASRSSPYNDTLLSTAFPEPLLLSTSDTETSSPTLIRSIGTLHDAQPDFNATAYLDNVAYIRFSDPKLPGPEYDVPYSQKVAARPKNKDADWTWTKLYGQFAQRRMDVCGLDLDMWRPE